MEVVNFMSLCQSDFNILSNCLLMVVYGCQTGMVTGTQFKCNYPATALKFHRYRCHLKYWYKMSHVWVSSAHPLLFFAVSPAFFVKAASLCVSRVFSCVFFLFLFLFFYSFVQFVWGSDERLLPNHTGYISQLCRTSPPQSQTHGSHYSPDLTMMLS